MGDSFQPGKDASKPVSLSMGLLQWCSTPGHTWALLSMGSVCLSPMQMEIRSYSQRFSYRLSLVCQVDIVSVRAKKKRKWRRSSHKLGLFVLRQGLILSRLDWSYTPGNPLASASWVLEGQLCATILARLSEVWLRLRPDHCVDQILKGWMRTGR